MERTPLFLRSISDTRRLSLVALCLSSWLLAGCGGGGTSRSVISTGFPAGNGTNSLVTPAAVGPGSMTLTASNLPSAIFFAAPKGVADTSASGCAADVCASATGGALTLVPGTAYQTPTGTQFPAVITMKIQYTLPSGTDPQTLNVYYFDGKAWQPALPASGGFSSTTAGVLTTTLQQLQGGLYAVMSAAPPQTPAAKTQ